MDVVPGRDGWVRLPMTAPYFRIFSPLGMAWRASLAQAQRRADRGVALLQHHLGARRQRLHTIKQLSSGRSAADADRSWLVSVVLCDFVSCMKSIFKLEVNQGNHHFRH